MEPTNDNERLIAQAVDEMFLEDPGNRHHLTRTGHRNVPRFHHNVPLGQSILSPLRPGGGALTFGSKGGPIS